jgi:hypothetical protein
VSRFRMAILLALVAVTALPTTAHAKRFPYCHLFSPEAVGRAVDYRGITVKGQEMDAPSLANSSGTMSVCDYWSGRDNIAESTVMTFGTAAKTAKEFRLQISGNRASHPRPVHGPWRKAYTLSSSTIFVLKGRHIFQIGYQVRTTETTRRALIRFARNAAAKL